MMFEAVQVTTDLSCVPALNRLCQTKELAATLTKARQALKQHWPNSVRRKQKMPAQAKAREQAKASQAEEVLKRQGRCAQDVPLLRHKWEATLLRQPLAESQKLWQLEA